MYKMLRRKDVGCKCAGRRDCSINRRMRSGISLKPTDYVKQRAATRANGDCVIALNSGSQPSGNFPSKIIARGKTISHLDRDEIGHAQDGSQRVVDVPEALDR